MWMAADSPVQRTETYADPTTLSRGQYYFMMRLVNCQITTRTLVLNLL
ncbi:hypothetical protein DNHGIG_15300 [Collibacillus ludicampi]|uniref:Uncharacterized protein n=1 Tax=Collibacillus ludicampi TaxID=2771369 RepID=A0AAV4LDW0_9BACL|nr:hypothetical protein DNHGIG_15300 [Collibacillus ludicampi]